MESIQTFGEKCKNCKHYLPHYIKNGINFISIPGHCICPEKYWQRGRKKYLLDDNCEYFEQCGDKKQEERLEICKVIERMHDQLTQILNILNEE